MPPKAKAKGVAKTKAKAKPKGKAVAKAAPPEPPKPDPEKCLKELEEALEIKPVAFARLRDALKHAQDADCEIEKITPAVDRLKLLESVNSYLEKVVANGVVDKEECLAKIGEAEKLEIDPDLRTKAKEKYDEFLKLEEERKKEEAEALEEIQKVQDAFDEEVDEVNKVLDNAKKAIEAADDEELKNVKKFVIECKGKLPLDCEDGEQETILSTACCVGADEIVDWLINPGDDFEEFSWPLIPAHIDCQNKYGQTPLLRACKGGHHVHIVEKLLGLGADTTIESHDGESASNIKPPLPIIKEKVEEFNEKTEILRDNLHDLQLLDQPWPRILRLAARDKDHTKGLGNVNKVLQFKGDPNAIVDFERGQRTLHIAAENGNGDMVSLLLKHNAQVDAPTKSGMTALMFSVLSGHKSIANMLLDKGAKTCLRCTTSSGESRGVTSFVKSGDDNLRALLMNHAKEQKDVLTLNDGQTSSSNAAVGMVGFGSVGSRAAQDATNALKNMSLDQLKEGGEEYKRLLEQRDLADFGYS